MMCQHSNRAYGKHANEPPSVQGNSVDVCKVVSKEKVTLRYLNCLTLCKIVSLPSRDGVGFLENS